MLIIGLSHAATSPLFRLSLRNPIDMTSPQSAFFAIVIIGVFLADYMCAGQTRFFLSLVRPTSYLSHLFLLLYANLCVAASPFASVVGFAATVGAFPFDYMSHPQMSAQLMAYPIVTANTGTAPSPNNSIVLGVDPMQSNVKWAFANPEAAVEWSNTAKKEQQGLIIRRLMKSFSYNEDNKIAYNPSTMINGERGSCPTYFDITISNSEHASSRTEMRITVLDETVNGTVDMSYMSAQI